MKKKTLLSLGVTAAVTAAAAPLFVLGKKTGIGPFAYLHDQDLSALPGNGPEYDFDSVLPMDSSPLEGKRVLVLGSSNVLGTSSMGSSVAEYLHKRFGCICTREAARGSTLCDLGPQSYVSRLKALDPAEPYDLVVCHLSSNDATKRLPLGSAGKKDVLGKTVAGGIRAVIDYVKETWGCPMVFFTNSYFTNDRYERMVRLLYDITEGTDVGVLDLWNDKNFNTISREEKELFMADAIHPTKAGYRNWWGPELERQLRRYLQRTEKKEEERQDGGQV